MRRYKCGEGTLKKKMGSIVMCVTLVMVVSRFSLIANSLACGQATFEDSERTRLQTLIEELQRNRVLKKDDFQKYVTTDNTPQLLDFALDEAHPGRFRDVAFLLLELVADDRIVDPARQYYSDCMTQSNDCSSTSAMGSVSAAYYRRSKDEAILDVYLEMLQDPAVDVPFKLGAVRMLGRCQSSRTNLLLRTLVIENDAYPSYYHKAEAARFIAESGDTSITEFLIENVNFIFRNRIEDLPMGGFLNVFEAINGLKSLALTDERANNALRNISQQLTKQAWVSKHIEDNYFAWASDGVFRGLALVGREENLRFLEQLVIDAKDTRIVAQMIKILEKTGDEKTVEFLRQFDRDRKSVK